MALFTSTAPMARLYSHIDRDNNIGLIRYILAVSIIINHFNILAGADIPIYSASVRVSGFFTISGFLLVGPFLRGRRFMPFIIDRFWRLMPAYVLVILFCALAGAFISSLPPGQYFTSLQFWKYLGANLLSLNFLQPDLPGVFSGYAIPAVNGALWTMKIEWQLLFFLPFVIWLCRRFRLDVIKVFLAIILAAFAYNIYFAVSFANSGDTMFSVVGRQFPAQLLYMMSGMLIYCAYPWFMRNKWKIFIPALILFCFEQFGLMRSDLYWLTIHPFVVSLLIMSIALTAGNYDRFIDHGHGISYEIYLCHFPVIQTFVYFGIPSRLGVPLAFALVLAVTVVSAIVLHKASDSIVRRFYRKP